MIACAFMLRLRLGTATVAVKVSPAFSCVGFWDVPSPYAVIHASEY